MIDFILNFYSLPISFFIILILKIEIDIIRFKSKLFDICWT